jgi:hypothetical protein
MQQLQLDRVPQPFPRPAEEAINELIPQLRKGGFDSLSHRADQSRILRRIGPRDDQYLRFLGQQLGQLWASVSQISQDHAALDEPQQRQGRVAIITVGWGQHRPFAAAVNVAQQMQLKAKEPAGAALAEISALFAQISDPAVAKGFAQTDRLGINQIQAQSAALTSRMEEMTDQVRQVVEAAQPFLIRTEQWESAWVIAGNELVSLFEGGDAKAALHQRDGDDLGIRESRQAMVGSPPISQLRMDLKEIIHEAVDFGHLVYTRSHGGHPPGARFRFLTQSYTPLGFG